jgi:hypothetical protein
MAQMGAEGKREVVPAFLQRPISSSNRKAFDHGADWRLKLEAAFRMIGYHLFRAALGWIHRAPSPQKAPGR